MEQLLLVALDVDEQVLDPVLVGVSIGEPDEVVLDLLGQELGDERLLEVDLGDAVVLEGLRIVVCGGLVVAGALHDLDAADQLAVEHDALVDLLDEEDLLELLYFEGELLLGHVVLGQDRHELVHVDVGEALGAGLLLLDLNEGGLFGLLVCVLDGVGLLVIQQALLVRVLDDGGLGPDRVLPGYHLFDRRLLGDQFLLLEPFVLLLEHQLDVLVLALLRDNLGGLLEALVLMDELVDRHDHGVVHQLPVALLIELNAQVDVLQDRVLVVLLHLEVAQDL